MLMFLLLFINPFWEKRYQVRVLKSGSNRDYILGQEFRVPSVRTYGIYKILNFLLVYMLFCIHYHNKDPQIVTALFKSV